MKYTSLLIAVPTTGGIMKSRTASSLMKLGKALSRRGIDYIFWNVDGSDVVTVRNRYANSVLESDEVDGMLFVDSDMEFEPRVAMKMIASGADLIAAAYKKKQIDLEAFAKAFAAEGDEKKALAKSGGFTVLPTWDARTERSFKVKNGFMSAAGAGMGLCLISRPALRQMVDEGAVEKLSGVLEGKQYSYWGFFNHVEHAGHHLLEDYSFCYRWTQLMKRELLVCIDEDVGHVGEFVYGGTYLHSLKGGVTKQMAKAE